MSNEMRKSLKDRAKEFSVRLPFMDGREKGEMKELLGQITTITDYGFLNNDDGSAYVAFITAERSKTFYFGGQVLTDQLAQLEAEGYHNDIINDGLPMLLGEKKSKNGKNYVTVEFYPED